MSLIEKPTLHVTATCPACGLLCDDLAISAPFPDKVTSKCNKAKAFFAQPARTISPQIAGNPVDLPQAIVAVADILRESRSPLFAGLGTEVQGMRAVMQLAEKTNATLDHMHAESMVRNTRAMQNSGWQTTTLTEIKNRADLIIAIGTDITSTHPRFFEKVMNNPQGLFKSQTKVIYLAQGAAPHELPATINALNALANGKTLLTNAIATLAQTELIDLLAQINAAKYCVIVWSAAKFDFAHAELTIESLTRLIATLNLTTRVAGFPLNSGDGDTSVNNTSTWLSGVATRSRFSNGKPHYNSQAFSTQKQLDYCDALLWISTFNPYVPPNTAAPIIVIGHPDTVFATPPAVFIPVGIPGLDHAGIMFRMDSAVTLPLKKIRDNTLPTLSQVIHQILDLLA